MPGDFRVVPGVLVFCGMGFAWHKCNLEDFANFYLTGAHRNDDLFALMKAHNMKQKGIELLRKHRPFWVDAPPHRETGTGGVSLSHSGTTLVFSATALLGHAPALRQ
jgi:hypothetical protein